MVRESYYGSRGATEPMSAYFTVPLRRMGHTVETFDHYEMSEVLGRERATEALVARISRGDFGVAFYQTSGREPIETIALAELSRRTCIAAWNSDDDWQWDTTSRIAGHFTFMITTYPHIYEQNRSQYTNLLLSQWGCPGELGDRVVSKDIPFSFVGSVYGERNDACRYLRRYAGLVCFGRGSKLVSMGMPYFRGAFKVPWLAGRPLELQQVYDVWNRTRVSYTPLKGSAGGECLQIKGRIFEMGLSGTLVLCEHNQQLERYYQPGREIVTFENLRECGEKANWYLSHESERARIARCYRERTLHEHMWEDRFADLLMQMGVVKRTSNLTHRGHEPDKASVSTARSLRTSASQTDL